MSVNLIDLAVKEYSDNLELLLQQGGSKLRGCVMEGNHIGKLASPCDQIGAVEMQEVTTRFGQMPRIDAATDRRWVSPTDYDLPQLVDTFDQLRLKVSNVNSSYVQNAAKAVGRQWDRVICAAFTGTALTGEAHGTSTSFTSGNEVDVAVGGANSTLNLLKLRTVKKLMETNHIDFESEEAFVGLTAIDHDALLAEVQITSSDYNGGVPVLNRGKIESFLGFYFKQCQLIETVLAGTNEVTLPVWVKSGMHLGIWKDMTHTIAQRHDLRAVPWQLYTVASCGATRLEENKVYAIESYRA